MSLRRLLTTLGSAALLALPAAGHAMPVGVGFDDPLLFSWSYGTGSSQLSGSASMQVSGFNSSTLSLLVTLTNTSAIGGQNGERLTAFAFGIDPNASSITFDDSGDAGMINAVIGQTLPGIADVEICAIGGSSCAGGGTGGIWAGGSDTFTILLGGQWGSSVEIDPIGLRYKTGYGAFAFRADDAGLAANADLAVPEPSTAVLAGLGAGLLGLGLRQRRRAATAGRARAGSSPA